MAVQARRSKIGRIVNDRINGTGTTKRNATTTTTAGNITGTTAGEMMKELTLRQRAANAQKANAKAKAKRKGGKAQ